MRQRIEAVRDLHFPYTVLESTIRHQRVAVPLMTCGIGWAERNGALECGEYLRVALAILKCLPQRGVGLAERRRQRDGPSCGGLRQRQNGIGGDAGHTVLAGHGERIAVGQPRPCPRVVGVGGDRSLEGCRRFDHPRSGAQVPVIATQQVRLVRGHVDGATDIARRVGDGGQCETHGRDDRSRHFVLHGEDVGGGTIETLRPEAGVVGDAYGAGRDAQLITRALDAAGEHRRYAKQSADRLQVILLVAHGERRGARGHAEAGHLRQRVDKRFGHAIAQVRARPVGAEVGEGEYGDGGGRLGAGEAA